MLIVTLAAALIAAGIKEGDRVAGYLPNIPEATAAMLATTAIGATWSSCSPDFGTDGVLDRFGQIEPKVLFCADGYLYGGKRFDLLDKVVQILEQLPSVERCVVVPYVGERPDARRLRNGVTLAEFVGGPLMIVLLALLFRRLLSRRLVEQARVQAVVAFCPPEDLTGAFDLSQPTISHHLKVLHEAGLLEREKRGVGVYYRARTHALASLGALIGSPQP